jgi:hypothetical protein
MKPLIFTILIITLLSAPVFSLQTDTNICQSENCQTAPGICTEGYYCFLTESNIPESIKCSSAKVTEYLDQKITENRFVIEADSSHMERYENSVMSEQMSKGCLLNEFKPLFIEGQDHITLTAEFINYDSNNLEVTLSWFLTPKSSGEEIDVTSNCPIQKINLLPKEDRPIDCMITNPTLLTDTEYTYHVTGTYDLPEGGTETVSSKEKRIIRERSILMLFLQ